MNEALKWLTDMHRHLKHSPFREKQVLYPFFIIEAKAEKGSAGFESIESQTAFPIRTFLKLQHGLQNESAGEFDPLVWFLACRGDEWRVYAGVFENPKTVRGTDPLRLDSQCSSLSDRE